MSISASPAADFESMQHEHFDPKGKLPSAFTIALQNGLRQSLPFEDSLYFDQQPRCMRIGAVDEFLFGVSMEALRELKEQRDREEADKATRSRKPGIPIARTETF